MKRENSSKISTQALFHARKKLLLSKNGKKTFSLVKVLHARINREASAAPNCKQAIQSREDFYLLLVIILRFELSITRKHELNFMRGDWCW